MKILRTPDDAADGLAGYPSERRWVEIPSGDGQRLRVHLVDANPDASSVIVLLHGNPSWSYLWRHQIGALVHAGYRVIAPDLVGMGMSDKPAALDDYTVERHVEWMRALLVDALALSDIDMVLHDWGGIIGMRLAAENPGLTRRMVISNTGLPDRDPAEPLPEMIEAEGPYADFQKMALDAPVWEPWMLLPFVTVIEPTSDVHAEDLKKKRLALQDEIASILDAERAA